MFKINHILGKIEISNHKKKRDVSLIALPPFFPPSLPHPLTPSLPQGTPVGEDPPPGEEGRARGHFGGDGDRARLLGPCEPGTSVTLEGIMWHETKGGE